MDKFFRQKELLEKLDKTLNWLEKENDSIETVRGWDKSGPFYERDEQVDVLTTKANALEWMQRRYLRLTKELMLWQPIENAPLAEAKIK